MEQYIDIILSCNNNNNNNKERICKDGDVSITLNYIDRLFKITAADTAKAHYLLDLWYVLVICTFSDYL